MSESSSIEVNGGRSQDFTIDQLAGATALVLGSVGGLLMIIWKSRCACRVRLGCSDKCYVFDCERKPPPDEDSDDEPTNKQNKILKKEKKILKKEDEILEQQKKEHSEPEPEPELIP
tara:strand:+ start:141 stop:491 length:351 start_codon:yes stop_codon:yes gene_type:complete